MGKVVVWILRFYFAMLEDDSVEQRSDSTFPFGEGGPLAVDEVESDGSYIRISFVFCYAKKSTLH